VEYDDRPLEADEVLIRTELATGKHGTTMAMMDDANFRGQEFDIDMHLFIDAKPGADRLRPTREKPWNTGNCGVGTIIAVGSKVTRWEVGDRVFGDMDIRETNIRKEDRLYALGGLNPETAACLEACHVPFYCMRDSHVRFGDTVAVVGLGAIGILAVKMARLSGADRVYAVDPLANRRELALKYGADEAFDPGEGDVPLKIHQLLGGRGVDVSIESSGAYAALHTAIRCARVGGTVCSAGFYQGESRGLWRSSSACSPSTRTRLPSTSATLRMRSQQPWLLIRLDWRPNGRNSSLQQSPRLPPGRHHRRRHRYAN
jgi:threonine dehydrogenase-like Zn-dependent dehydrogenase